MKKKLPSKYIPKVRDRVVDWSKKSGYSILWTGLPFRRLRIKFALIPRCYVLSTVNIRIRKISLLLLGKSNKTALKYENLERKRYQWNLA